MRDRSLSALFGSVVSAQFGGVASVQFGGVASVPFGGVDNLPGVRFTTPVSPLAPRTSMTFPGQTEDRAPAHGDIELGRERVPMMNRPLALVFLAGFGMAMSFYLLLSVAPLYAASVGAGGIGAGLTTGALMFTTVGVELVTPSVVGRFGYRRLLAVGLLLLGAPALALIAANNVWAILAVNLVRGVGFAIAVVLGSALVAALVPAERRGEGLGVYGLVVGVPSVVGLPAGVWLAAHAGYPTVFILAAASGLIGLVAVPGLPKRTAPDDPPIGMIAALRSAELARPAVIFSTTAIAAGAVYTFLPLALSGSAASVGALALLAHSCASTLARWWAGHHGDRHDSAQLLVPSVALGAAGVAALAFTSSPVAVLVGMTVFGCGFGIAQNASLMSMYEHTGAAGYDAVSAMWNLAYDSGLGIGGVAFGLAAAQTGYPIAFVLTAAVMLVAIGVAWRSRRGAAAASR